MAQGDFIRRGCGSYVEGETCFVKDGVELWQIADILEEAKEKGIDIGHPMIGTKEAYTFRLQYYCPNINPVFFSYQKIAPRQFPFERTVKGGLLYDVRNPDEWLHWIGRGYYTKRSFIREAEQYGISREIRLQTLKRMWWSDLVYLMIFEGKKYRRNLLFGRFEITRLQGLTDKAMEYLRGQELFGNSEYNGQIQEYKNYCKA